jgi:hypothetical protein
MSKKTKQVTKKEKRRAQRRQERRFVSQASGNTTAVRAVSALAAMLLGAGAWGYLYAQSFAEDEKLRALPSYLVAAGAVLLGVAIWFGTSSEPPVRVGAPGIAVEKGELRRMPWWGVEKIAFDSGAIALVVTGQDEAGVAWTFKVPLKAHPDAVAWIVKEASERVPKTVDVTDELREKLPLAALYAGTLVDHEPLQVVGRRDAVSGKIISYEPDACVCGQCERVYLKRSVPKKCKCGSSLAHLRPKDAADTNDDDEDEDERDPADAAAEAAEG